MMIKSTVIIVFLLYLGSKSQSVQYNREFQVNTYINNAQIRPDIARLSEDKFVICWQSDEQDGSNWGIYAQIFDQNAQKLGAEFRVNKTVEGSQSYPRVCGLTNGGFVICWQSYAGLGGFGTEVIAQRYDKDGIRQGEEFQVNTYTENYQYGPRICGLTNGNFVVCWNSLDQDGSGDGIFGQMFNSDAMKIGDEFQVNTYADNRQKYPDLCGLSGGGFVVCWESYGQDEEYDGIIMQMYDSSGARFREETIVNTYGLRFQGRPSVDLISDDRFVICWHSDGNQDGEGSAVIGQMFDGSGAKHGNEFIVNTYSIDDQYSPSISRLADSGFIICWVSDEQDGDERGVFAQMYDNNGSKNGQEFPINSFTESYQYRPRVCGLENGDLVICWETVGQDGSSHGIVAKYYLGVQVLHALEPFSLISPAMDATVSSTTSKFQWQIASDTHLNFPWELKYSVYLDNNTDFYDPEKLTWVNDTLYLIDNLIPGQTYFWKVLAKNIIGDSLWSSQVFGFYVSHSASIEDDLTRKPENYKLFPNYPNPFNPKTIVKYELPNTNDVEVNIYNLRGQKVVNLISEKQNAGYHQVEWDAREHSSGIYFLILEAGNYRASQKMLLVK
jgi:hypothetical protein